MTHIFIKPEIVVETAVKVLQRDIVLPGLITLNGLGDFGGSKNDTINVRVNALASARTRTFRGTGADRNVTADDLVETVFGVTLDNVLYSAILLTDEQLTLDIRDYAQQVLMPQVSAVSYKFEDYVGGLIENAPYASTTWIDPTDTFPAFVDARRQMNDENVPFNDRVLVVGSAVEAVLLKDPQFRHYDALGEVPNTAIHEARIGRIAGLDVVRSNAVAPDYAYQFHKSAFIVVSRAPVAPMGVNAAASYSSQGVAWRWLADYDYFNLTDRSILDTYVGQHAVLENDGRFVRGVQLRLASTGINAGLDFGIVGTASTQLKVLDSNGVDVTAAATFVSATTAKATVGTHGLVTGVAAGTSVLTVSYVLPSTGATVTDTVTVTVT